jgi:hypothetical protein
LRFTQSLKVLAVLLRCKPRASDEPSGGDEYRAALESRIKIRVRKRICAEQVNLPTALIPFRYTDVSGLSLKRILVFHSVLDALGYKVLAKFKRPVKEMNIREPAEAKE